MQACRQRISEESLNMLAHGQSTHQLNIRLQPIWNSTNKLHHLLGFISPFPLIDCISHLQGLAKRCRKYKVKAVKQGYSSIREKAETSEVFYQTMLVHLRKMFDDNPDSLDELAGEDHSQPMTRADRQLYLPRVSFRNKERKKSPGGTTQPVRDHPEYAEVHKKVSGESHFYREMD